MHKEFRASLWLRAFDWNAESGHLMIYYRNHNVITFFNVSEEAAEKFNHAILKSRYIKIMKRKNVFPFNFAKKRPSN